MVPRENEEINETWIADRDRFGFEGMYSGERVSQPMLRIDGELQSVDWEVALNAAAEGLKKAAGAGKAATGFLASPQATVEELFLLAQIARGLGSNNIDHRLRQLDFRAQDAEGAYPYLGLKIAEVEQLEGVLMVGSDLRHEMPLLAHRIRKAAIKGGAQVAFVNPRRFEYMFPICGYVEASDLVAELSALVHAAWVEPGARGGDLSARGHAGGAAANKPVPAGVGHANVAEVHKSVISALS